MKRLLSLLLALTLSLSLLCACGEDTDTQVSDETATAPQTAQTEPTEPAGPVRAATPEEAINNYLDMYYGMNFDKLETLAPPEFWTSLDITLQQAIDTISASQPDPGSAADMVIEMVGENWRMTFEMTGSEAFTEDMMTVCAKSLSLTYGLDTGLITEGQLLYGNGVLSGDADSVTVYEDTSVYLICYDSNWYLVDENNGSWELSLHWTLSDLLYEDDTESNGSQDYQDYLITVISDYGDRLADVRVTVHDGEGPFLYLDTDEDGVASFSLPADPDLYVTVSDVPNGYEFDPETRYGFTDGFVQICLTAQVTAQAPLSVGSRATDAAILLSDGSELDLMEALGSKDMLMLIFCFGGDPDALHLESLNEHISAYEQSVEVLLLTPVHFTDMIDLMLEEHALPFSYTIYDQNSVDVSAFPTTVIIDRNGTVCLNDAGSWESELFPRLLTLFTDPNYTQTLLPNGIIEA